MCFCNSNENRQQEAKWEAVVPHDYTSDKMSGENTNYADKFVSSM